MIAYCSLKAHIYGEMAKWVLSSDPQHPYKKWGMAAHTNGPDAVVIKTDKWMPGAQGWGKPAE